MDDICIYYLLALGRRTALDADFAEMESLCKASHALFSCEKPTREKERHFCRIRAH